MRLFLTCAFVAVAVGGCAGSGERPVSFPGTANREAGFTCAAEILDERFTNVVRNPDAGTLTAERGRSWVYVTLIPVNDLTYQIQVVASRGARQTMRDITTRCSR